MCKKTCYEICKGKYFILRFVCDSREHYESSQFRIVNVNKKGITEITNSFNINEVEYRKLISSFVETDCYITEVTNALSFYCSVTTQDVIHPTSKRSSKLKTRPKTTVMISSSPKH